MASRRFSFILTLLLCGSAWAGDIAAPQPAVVTEPATQPVKKQEGYRYLDQGSWIISEAHIRSNGTPATLRRKVLITSLPKTPERAIEESRWHNNAFESTGPLQALADPDRRSFDEMGYKPKETQADAAVTIAHKRYLCTVTTYEFCNQAEGRKTLLTLWRDKSGETRSSRTISINNKEIPLPQDALQADFTVEGPKVSTHGQRRIVALSSPLRINNQTCNCLVESTCTQGASNDKPMSLSMREWFCHELPGERIAR